MADDRQSLRILFVCTGNICRSAMAQAFFRSEVHRRGLSVDVRSAGTRARTGERATIEGRAIMSQLGSPIDDHLADAISPYAVEWADLVLGMTLDHVGFLQRSFPAAAKRTWTLKGFVEMEIDFPWFRDPDAMVGVPDGESVEDQLSGVDIVDPIGRPLEVYEAVAREIQGLVVRLAERLERKVGRP